MRGCRGEGMHGCQGACMVAGGHAWLLGEGACMVGRRGMHGWQGGHVWLACVVGGGVHGCQGACVVAWGACIVVGGMRGCTGGMRRA